MKTLDQIFEVVKDFPPDLMAKVVLGKLSQNDMAHVLHQIEIEWGFVK